MIFIGITGGIGSGKSTVCSLFSEKGLPVFAADSVAREVSETTALPEIIREFGMGIVDASNRLDRKKLASIVFQDEQQLLKLNSLIHPKVFEVFRQWKQQNFDGKKFALVEAALMFESGMFEMMDYVLAVVADEQIRIDRVIARDGSSAEQVTGRMKHQLSNEVMLELSDFQIQNNGTLKDLETKIGFFTLLFSTLTQRKDTE
ncbi:MAG: dephospho-CoA kinase [Bacteroidota bacterium]|jgi:dephospho-CoA kinase